MLITEETTNQQDKISLFRPIDKSGVDVRKLGVGSTIYEPYQGKYLLVSEGNTVYLIFCKTFEVCKTFNVVVEDPHYLTEMEFRTLVDRFSCSVTDWEINAVGFKNSIKE